MDPCNNFSSATDARAITPDDANDLNTIPYALYVGTGGTVALIGTDAPATAPSVLFRNLASGQVLNIRPRRVLATGTTASDIVGLFWGSVDPGPVNQVAPILSGNNTVGSVITSTNGTWTGSPDLEGQWYRDTTPISSETGVNYTVLAGDIGYKITRKVTGTVGSSSTVVSSSNAVFPIGDASSSVTTYSFDVADGTSYTALGLIGYGPSAYLGNYETSGGNLSNSGSGSFAYLEYPYSYMGRDSTFVNHAVEIDWGADRTDTVICSDGDKNYVGLLRRNDAVFQFYKSVEGTQYYDDFGWVTFSSAPVAGDVIKLEIAGGNIAVYFNGTQYSIGPNPGPGVGTITRNLGTKTAATPDATSLGAAAGTIAGFMPQLFGNTGSPVKFYAADIPFTIQSINDSAIPTNVGRTIVVTGSYTGVTPTGIDLGLIDMAGVVIIPRTPATVVSIANGTWVVTITSTLLTTIDTHSPSVRLQAWEAGDHALYQEKTWTPTVYASIEAYQPLLNANGVFYFKLSSPYRDLVKAMSWGGPIAKRMNGGVVVNGMDKNGVIYSYESGQTSVTCTLPWYMSNDRTGPNNVFVWEGLDPNTVVTINVFGHVGGTPAIVVTQQPGAVSGEFHFYYTMSDPQASDQRSRVDIVFSGPINQDPTSGGLNRNWKCRLVSDRNSTLLLTDKHKTIYANAKGVRFMQGDGIIAPPSVPGGIMDASYVFYGTGFGVVGPKTKVQICNELGVDLYNNIPDQAGLDYITEEATYIRDHLAGKSYWEYSNEIWNIRGGFAVESGRVAVEGIKKGWYDSAATPTTSTSPYVTIDPCDATHSIINENDGTITSKIARNVGDYMFAVWFGTTQTPPLQENGQYLIRVTSAIAAGGKINGSNCTLEIGSAACEVARGRQAVTEELNIDSVLSTVLGVNYPAKARVLHAERFGATASEISTRLGWNDAYKLLKGYVLGVYWDNYNNSRDTIGLYVSTSIAGWTTTEHAKYLTDLPVWLNSVYTGTANGSGNINVGPLAVAAKSAVIAMTNTKHDVERQLRLAHSQYVPNSIQMMTYEIGNGVNFSDYSSSNGYDAAKMTQALAALRTDARWRIVQNIFYSNIKANIGSVHATFVDIESYPDPLAHNTFDDFGLLDNEDDIGSPRWLGWQDVTAG